MADEGQVSPLQPRSPGSTDEVAGATLNPDAAVFHPRQEERSTTNKMNLEKPEPSLVFGGGGHFLSKYGSQGHSDRATGKSTLRKRQPVATESGQPDRVNVQLNQLIVHAGMPERILQIVDENFDQLNVVNLITALHRLASISLASRKAALRRELRFRRLVTRLSDTVRKAEPSTLKPQDLSNAVWALTKLGIQNAILYNLLADRILLRMDDFKPVNLSMTLWAFARSGIYDEKLLAAASTEVKKQLDDFEPQQVANTAWAMAKCGYVDQELFERTAVHAMSALDTYQPMNFSMLVYAFALAHLPHQELFEEVAKRCTVQALKHSFTAPNVVSNLALAYSEAQVNVPELYETVAQVSIHVIHEFKPKQIVTLSESFSKAQVNHDALFRCLSKNVANNIEDYTKEELQDLFKAFEALGVSKSEIQRAVDGQENAGSAYTLRTFLLVVMLIALTFIVWRI